MLLHILLCFSLIATHMCNAVERRPSGTANDVQDALSHDLAKMLVDDKPHGGAGYLSDGEEDSDQEDAALPKCAICHGFGIEDNPLLTLQCAPRHTYCRNCLARTCNDAKLCHCPCCVTPLTEVPQELKPFLNRDVNCSTELFAALRKNDIRALSESLADVTNAREEGSDNTALHIAVINSFAEGADYLLKKCPSILGAIDKHGNTALHIAAWNGDLTMVEKLTEQGADVTAQTKNGNTPLALAIYQNHIDVINFFITNYPHLLKWSNTAGNKTTALHCAAKQSNTSTLACVLKACKDAHKSFLEKVDGWGETPLIVAVKAGNAEAVAFFFEAKVNQNIKDPEGNSILHIAVRHKQTAIANCIIDRYPHLLAGVPVRRNHYTVQNLTPLDIAIETNQYEMIQQLLARGAKPSLFPETENTVLHYIAQSDLNDAIAAATTVLLAEPSLINALNSNKDTPLHIAARCGNLAMVKCLHAKGASLDLVNAEGHTCFQVTIMSMNAVAIMRYLATANPAILARDGALAFKLIDRHMNGGYSYAHARLSFYYLLDNNVTIALDGWHYCSAALIAISARSYSSALDIHDDKLCFKILTWLHGHGANIEQKDHDGLTPLLKAASKGIEDTSHCNNRYLQKITLLLAQGADCRAKTPHGENVLHLNQNKAIAELFIARAPDLLQEVNNDGLKPHDYVRSRYPFVSFLQPPSNGPSCSIQ